MQLFGYKKSKGFLTGLGVLVGVFLAYNLVFYSWHTQYVHQKVKQQKLKAQSASSGCETFVCKAMEQLGAN